MTGEYIIETNNLSIGYSDNRKTVEVKSNLNLRLRKGELCCLIGPNGVGKSTLLRTIGKQLKSLRGHILLEQRSLEKYSSRQIATKISVVLTETIHVPNLTVKELVSMGRFPYSDFWGNLDKDDIERIMESMELVGIQDLSERTFDELSDGEKQKALIAKALAQNTPLILLDEPTAYLDFPSKMNLFSELRKIAHLKQIGIVISTHDLELALKIADLIWLMPQNGQVKSGIPEDLALSEAISKTFSSTSLSFDLKTAHFSYHLKTHHLLHVSGKSIEIEWLKRALLRKGISPDSNIEMPLNAEYDSIENKYILQLNNQIIGTFGTIQQILEKIENTHK